VLQLCNFKVIRIYAQSVRNGLDVTPPLTAALRIN